ncbi:MAG: TonB family protein [Bacteroides sp.]|jgi:TonB family protein|nr:TonB family protein [Bacteroides sp.]
MEKSKKKFLKLPHLDGGKEKLRQFFKENQRYPKEALEKGIEGDVVVKYKVNDKGEVFQAVVEHGIGYGCDEEALRLVGMLQYEGVKNRGVRVTSNSRMKIPFRLPKKTKAPKMKMVYAEKPKTHKPSAEKQAEEKKPQTYTYTIKL